MASPTYQKDNNHAQVFARLVATDGSDATLPSSTAVDSTGVVKAPTYTFLGSQLGLTCVSSTGLTVPTGTRYAQIQAAVQNVRYRYGADAGTITPTAPTASTGMRLLANSELACDVATISNMRFIEETSGALLNVSYFG